MADEPIKVLLANQDEEELARVAELITENGHEVVDLAITRERVADATITHKPDLAIVLLEGDEHHALDLVTEIRSFADVPLVLMSRQRVRDDTLRYAADHAVEILNLPSDKETVERVIEVALRRFEERRAQERRIGDFDGILERRTTIEQAKGIMMERHGIDADDAFHRLRSHARENQVRVVDVADSVITARDLLKNSD